jgi:glycosyltransferase involved in cell wall biosynthesis
MNVLLIGKYPPCQGGIAAKTYWLIKALASRTIHFDIVTLVPDLYRTPAGAPEPGRPTVRALEPCSTPWFLPGGDLVTERLVTAALELVAARRPDVIEVNYLAPFGLAAMVLADLLRVPLLVRHAGSDLVKLLGWNPTHDALAAVLRRADRVVTSVGHPSGSLAGVRQVAGGQPPPGEPAPTLAPTPPPALAAVLAERLICLPRYVPDPSTFRCLPPKDGPPRLLLAGKVNYHWCYKALDTMAAALILRPDWQLEAVADGIGREAFQAELERRGLTGRVSWRPFVAPPEMPALFGACTAVWAVDRPNDVTDFSNLVFEALAAGRPCLVSPATVSRAKAEAEAVALDEADAEGVFGAKAVAEMRSLIVVDPDDPLAVAQGLDRARDQAAEPHSASTHMEFVPAYQAYVDANVALYRQLEDMPRSSTQGRGASCP